MKRQGQGKARLASQNKTERGYHNPYLIQGSTCTPGYPEVLLCHLSREHDIESYA